MGTDVTETKFTKDQLDTALRAMWDLLEYCEWTPTHETAKGIKDGELYGDKITGQIHKRFMVDEHNEFRSSIKTMLDAWVHSKFIPSYEWTDEKISWVYEGVPCELAILQRRYKFFDNLDFAYYNYDDFKMPNPFEKYFKARFIVR